MITVFNTEKLLEISKDIPIDKIKNLLEEQFSLSKDVNIIFVESAEIKNLNKEYRDKDEVTDVLSFNLDSNDTLGEIYVSPEYIIKNISEEIFTEEILRVLVHGILHLKGYTHKKKFDKFDYKGEPMYIKQEDLLNKILTQLKQK